MVVGIVGIQFQRHKEISIILANRLCVCDDSLISVGRMVTWKRSLHIDPIFLDFRFVSIVGIQIQRHKERSIILAKRSCVCDGSLISVGRMVTWERSLHIDPLFFRFKVCGHCGHPYYKT